MQGFPSDMSHWVVLRHHEPDEPLNARVRQFGMRHDREAVNDPNTGELVKIGKDTPKDFGDFPTWGHWQGTKERSDETQPDGAELGAWSQAMPSVVRGGSRLAALATMARTDAELRPKMLVQSKAQTLAHAQAVGARRGNAPIVRGKVYPLWPEGDLYERRLPAGTPGVTVTATYPDEQVDLFLPSAAAALISDHRSEAPDLYSSVVYDVVGDELSVRYRARLSTVVRVAMPGPTMGAQPGLALVATSTPSGPGYLTAWFNGSYPSSGGPITGADQEQDALGGGFIEHDTPADDPVAGVGVYSTISWERGGTTHPGAGAADKHLHGFDTDGTPWTGAHTDTSSNFYMNVRMDAPLDFEPAFHPICAEGLFPYQVHLRYDLLSRHQWQGRDLEGLWRWHVKIPIGQPFRGKPRPKKPTPPDDPGDPGPPWTGDPPGDPGDPGDPGGPPGSPSTGNPPPKRIYPAMSWVPYEGPPVEDDQGGRYPTTGPEGTFAGPDDIGDDGLQLYRGNWAEEQELRARQDIKRRQEERAARRANAEAQRIKRQEERARKSKEAADRRKNWAAERELRARRDIARRERTQSPGAAKRAADAQRNAEAKLRREALREAREAARLAAEEELRAAIAERKAASDARTKARKEARLGSNVQGSFIASSDQLWPDDADTVDRVKLRPADVALGEGEHIHPSQIPTEVSVPSIYGMAVPVESGTPAWNRFKQETGHGFLAAPLTAHLQAFGTEYASRGWNYTVRPSWRGGPGPIVSGISAGGFAFLPVDKQLDDDDPWTAGATTPTFLFHPYTQLAFSEWSFTGGLPVSGMVVSRASATRVDMLFKDSSGVATGGTVQIDHVLRLNPRALPGSPAAGDIAIDSAASNALKWHNGSGWQAVGTGSGDVSSTSNFTADNRLTKTDRPTTDNKVIQPTGITVDDSNNVSGVGTLGCGAITSSGAINRNGLIDDKGAARGYLNGGVQTISATTWTKLQLDEENYDVDGWFDKAAYRYTPLAAGKYVVNARALTDVVFSTYADDPTTNGLAIAIYKNGSAIKYGVVGGHYVEGDGASYAALAAHDVVDMNGSTDYLEIYVYSVAGCNFTNSDLETVATFERVD